VAVAADDRAMVEAFYRAAIAAGGSDNGPPGLSPHHHSSYNAVSCAIPTAIMWKRCAAASAERPVIVNGRLRKRLKSSVQLIIHRCE